jgi:hypothetical protein
MDRMTQEEIMAAMKRPALDSERLRAIGQVIHEAAEDGRLQQFAEVLQSVLAKQRGSRIRRRVLGYKGRHVITVGYTSEQIEDES